MIPNSMNSSTTNNLLEVVDRVYKLYSLTLPHYMVSAIIGTWFGYNKICRLLLPLGWERHVFPDYYLLSVPDANGNILLR